MASKLPEKAIQLIRKSPRVALNTLKPLPNAYTIKVSQVFRKDIKLTRIRK